MEVYPEFKRMEPVQKSIDSYIKDFPKDIQIILEKVRETIQNSAPEAKETIKYGIPTYTMNGLLGPFCCL